MDRRTFGRSRSRNDRGPAKAPSAAGVRRPVATTCTPVSDWLLWPYRMHFPTACFLVGCLERLGSRWATRIHHDDVDAAEVLDRGRHELLEVVRARDVAGDRDTTDTLRLVLEDVPTAGEHDDVRTRFGERLRTAQPDACGSAADDGRAAAQPNLHL